MLSDSVNRSPIHPSLFGKLCVFVFMCVYLPLYSAAACLATESLINKISHK